MRRIALFLAFAVAVHLRSAEHPPAATTGEATALGRTAISVNGTVHPHGLPTTYYFEYGTTTDYGARTATRPLPPRLAAYYQAHWDEGRSGWGTRLKADFPLFGGISGGFMSVAEPSADDYNHQDGIGTVHLLEWLYIGQLGNSVYLSGGDADLRDARVSVWVRGDNWQPNGSEVQWWSQSQSNIEVGESPQYQRANWAYTAVTLTDALADGEWHQVNYRLFNDTTKWTYAGNNPTQQSNAGRYSYWSIDSTLEHSNDDFFHMATYVDRNRPPSGAIDFDEFTLVYRNKSLVFPSNGGHLVQAPESAGENATALTDGWRWGDGHMWQSAASPSLPLDFVYAFDSPVTIDAVQIHQNPDWPARDVDVSVSADGKEFTPLAHLFLPERGWPTDNYGFDLVSGLASEACYLKATIRTCYRTERCGLGEIEVFGSGATMMPENETTHVNTDIDGLLPGTTYHYRLVATNARRTVRGHDRTFTTPADIGPLAETGAATRVTPTSARVDGRTNAMGFRTTYYFEYGPDTSYGMLSASSDAGLQITPRLSFKTLDGLLPATTYHYRIVAFNDFGIARGEDRTFRTLDAQ